MQGGEAIMLNHWNEMSVLMTRYDYEYSIFQKLIELLNFYLNKHSKCLVVRFDLTFPLNYMSVAINVLISSFTQKLIQKYKRQGLDPFYIWAREQNTSDHPHYHFALLLNGHKIESFSHVFMNAQSLWASTLGVDVSGQVHYCIGEKYYKNYANGIMIEMYHDEAQAKYDAVICQLSYLAKIKDKRDYGDPWRNFGMSRLE